jgi:dihydroorotase
VQASPFLFRNARIVDPSDSYDEIGDLLIANGTVTHRGARLSVLPPDTEIIDASGLIASPGFVDLHTHLRYPGFPAKETMASGSAAAAAGGFTTICCMANTDPVVDSVPILLDVVETASREARVHVLQLAAVTVGLEGVELTNFADLLGAGAAGFSDDGKPVWNAETMRAALEAVAPMNTFVSAHEEDPDLVADGVANAGERARRFGLSEWPCSGEAKMIARDVRLAESTGGHLHVAHVSCADSVPIIRDAKLRGIRVTAEVAPHHLRLTDTLLDGDPILGLAPAHPCVKVNPPLRSADDLEVLVEALADGTIDVVATDHAPHATEDKSGTFAEAAFGFSGIETALPLCLELVREGRIPLSTIVGRLTVSPAAILGRIASLRPSSVADVCIFDPEEMWTVTAGALRSQGKNTPLLGAHLKGRVRYTLVGGAMVHRGDIAKPS